MIRILVGAYGEQRARLFVMYLLSRNERHAAREIRRHRAQERLRLGFQRLGNGDELEFGPAKLLQSMCMNPAIFAALELVVDDDMRRRASP